MLPQWQAAAAAGPVGLVAVYVQSAGEELSRERVSIGSGLCADIPLYTSLREKIQYNSLFSRWTCCKRLKAVFIGGGVIIFHVISLSYIYNIFPAIDEGLKQHIKIPYNLEEAKNLGMVLEHYTEQYFLEVFLSVFFIYIFMQTFAIPGSIFLSMLCGYLFNYPLALILVCFCSATGASLCYLLSSVLGRYVAYKILSHRIPEWAIIVKKQEDNLLYYLVFLRVTPFLPNWFINIVAPIINIPLFPFWLGTFIGVAPPSIVALQAGKALYQLSTSTVGWTWTSVFLLSLSAALSLTPVLIKYRLRAKFE